MPMIDTDRFKEALEAYNEARVKFTQAALAIDLDTPPGGMDVDKLNELSATSEKLVADLHEAANELALKVSWAADLASEDE
ncbi:hypothetical protein [Pseudomonas iridis]|uniref:hypothetical protein n=1 Tax=Pseudomonas iridis TaxID=2710587 RepID=UPI001B321BC7|nr:hypothetical protein [Pseudomonas iridis]MBP5966970.1 hypothetical protein [Pseudomonas iridis]